MQASDLASLLDWYAAVGVDVALGDDPVDRFLESVRESEARQARAEARPAPMGATVAPTRPGVGEREAPPFEGGFRRAPAAEAPPAPPREPPPERRRFEAPPQPVARPSLGAAVPGDAGVVAAREAAASAATLDELRAALERFEGCNLRLTARRLVFADGAPGARVMFVGEAPGREEDETGVPFVGRSGHLLDRMLAGIGLARSDVYIANVVPWRPPGNRTPTPQETEICKPFVARQIELVAPEVLVFLGGAAAAALTGATQGIMRLRGRWLTQETAIGALRAMPTLHPAYLLRQPIHKRLAWRDFLEIRKALDTAGR
jgi:DNA polymerase